LNGYKMRINCRRCPRGATANNKNRADGHA
jgi:hypothetical protein